MVVVESSDSGLDSFGLKEPHSLVQPVDIWMAVQ